MMSVDSWRSSCDSTSVTSASRSRSLHGVRSPNECRIQRALVGERRLPRDLAVASRRPSAAGRRSLPPAARPTSRRRAWSAPASSRRAAPATARTAGAAPAGAAGSPSGRPRSAGTPPTRPPCRRRDLGRTDHGQRRRRANVTPRASRTVVVPIDQPATVAEAVTDDPAVLDVDPAWQDVGEPEPSRVVQGLRRSSTPVTGPASAGPSATTRGRTPSLSGPQTESDGIQDSRRRRGTRRAYAKLPSAHDLTRGAMTQRTGPAHACITATSCRISAPVRTARDPTVCGIGPRAVDVRPAPAADLGRAGDLASVERAIAALEAQRAVLGDEVVDDRAGAAAGAPGRARSGSRGEQRKLVTRAVRRPRRLHRPVAAARRRRTPATVVGAYFARWQRGHRGAGRGRREVHRRRGDGGLRAAVAPSRTTPSARSAPRCAMLRRRSTSSTPRSSAATASRCRCASASTPARWWSARSASGPARLRRGRSDGQPGQPAAVRRARRTACSISTET